MTKYYKEYDGPTFIQNPDVKNTLGEILSHEECRQLHIAETEKFAHATFFLNGGQNAANPGEIQELIPSHKDVPTHDLAPKMRAEAIADKTIEFIEEEEL